MTLPATPDFDPHGCALAGLQLIEASAGTGKTWNIAALYLRLVLEGPWSVRQILVLSFTKAATAELRERIRDRLAELALACDAEDPPALLARLLRDAETRTGCARTTLAARVRLALQDFDQSAIQTIHGFCQRALADAPFVAGVPLDAEQVASDLALATEVVHDFWRQHTAREALHPALAKALLSRREGPESLARLLHRHQAKPLARVEWGTPDAPQSTSALDAVEAAFPALCETWRAEQEALIAALMAGFDQLDRRSFKTTDVLHAAAEAWTRALAGGDPWFAIAKGSPLGRLKRETCSPTKTAQKAGARPVLQAFPDLAQEFLALRERAEGAVAGLRRQLLRTLVEHCLPQLAERKRRLRVQTFDDLLVDLHRVLAGPRGDRLAASIRERYPVALIDEFQDTDPVQLDILRRIYQGSGRGVFLVGDPKQAIYGFRNADLDSYLDARCEVEVTGSGGAVTTLRHNQRASVALIAALNTLYVTSPHPFLIPELRYQEVLPGAKPRVPLHGDPLPRAALQVWLLPRGADGQPPTVAEGRALAFAACADEIVRLLEAARATLRLGERPLRAGDIAVLVRSHSDGRAMRAALARHGVASVELSQAGIFASLDARELECLLAAVVEPGHTGLALAAAATSLLGNDALAIDDIRSHEAALSALMLDFADALARWQQRGFGAMLWPLLDRRGVSARLLARDDGARRMTNLRHLAELLQAAAASRPAPEVLLGWLRTQIADAPKDEELQLRLDSDADLVGIVTVHHAKGLEYPVVFCPGLWPAGKPPQADPAGVREYHRDGAAWIDYRRADDLEPDENEAIRSGMAAEAFAETLRLIYVALTRAAQRCYLVAGAFASSRKPDAPCTGAARAPLNWLVHAAPISFADWRARSVAAEVLDGEWQHLADRLGDPASLAVDRLPADSGRVWRSPPADPDKLQAAAAPGIPPRWRISSYSALVAGRPPRPEVFQSPLPEREGRDHDALAGTVVPGSEVPLVDDDLPLRPAEPLPASAPRDETDILDFPRGPEAGTCLHAILEDSDFADPASWGPAIDRALALHGGWLASVGEERHQRQRPAMLRAWLRDLVTTPLPPGFRLDALDPRHCLRELEFHLPVGALQPEPLGAVLAGLGLPGRALQFDTLRGYLKGFIDLVVEHEGRWYVLDWKSNHLGHAPEDYAQARVDAEMRLHDYPLQALIYLLALDRLLRRRLRGYTPERHLGGALYLFVRGVRPGWTLPDGSAAGCWFLPAPQAALAGLAAAVAGSEGMR